jgi:hypothetical protein
MSTVGVLEFVDGLRADDPHAQATRQTAAAATGETRRSLTTAQ